MSRSLYRPLENDGDSFRLVKLHCGKAGDPVVLTLVSSRLSEGHDYEALSYVWGSPADEAGIEVDGVRMPIRRSLFDFFSKLRQSGGPRLLYADAICINQADDVERSRQVCLMKDIYRNARKVLAWLGPGSPETDGLFSLARSMSASDYSADDDGGKGSWRRPPEASEPAVWTSLQSTLRLVMEHAYWRRAWIIQECLLARDLSFCVGAAQVSWDQFSAVHMMLLDKSPVVTGYTWGFLKENITRFDHLAGQKNRMHEFPIPLAGIVSRFSAAESTDPRDMVFAFSALTRELQPGHPGGLVVDYGLTTTSLYFRAAHAYLVGDSSTGRPHRTLYGLRTMLHLTPLELLDVVLALIDPDELLSPARWIVGDWAAESTPQGRTFRNERKHSGLAYMDCHAADFATLVRLLDAEEGRV